MQSEGWPDTVIGPSPEAYSARTIVPKEATKEDIEKFKADWVAAVKRALKAGVDVGRCPYSETMHSSYSRFRLSRCMRHMGTY